MAIEIVDLPLIAWWFSIVTLVYQRVVNVDVCWDILPSKQGVEGYFGSYENYE